MRQPLGTVLSYPGLITSTPDTAITLESPAYSLQEKVLELIVSGRIAPGEPIRQDRVAHDFGISKVPLREVLARLEEMGLVEGAMHRGYVAAPLSREEADDLFSTRLMIEPATAGVAAERASDDDRRTVEDLQRHLGRLPDSAPETASARLGLIQALLRPARRPSVVKIVAPLFYRSERYFSNGAKNVVDAPSLDELVRAWILARPGAVRELYEHRLATRWKAALIGFGVK